MIGMIEPRVYYYGVTVHEESRACTMGNVVINAPAEIACAIIAPISI